MDISWLYIAAVFPENSRHNRRVVDAGFNEPAKIEHQL
jgi:hypothetical protein